MGDPSVESKRLNVLVLDGGGVRGLSSLLILQTLMANVNRKVGAASGELHPQDVFQLVAGTSTGGLIALMLGKMGMTVDECIVQYQELSRKIFGKKHTRGRMTHGLATPKYCGKRLRRRVRKLLRDRQLDEDLHMVQEPHRVACAVICREHCSPSQYSKLKGTAVPICSLPCEDNICCKVCDAARATSAAPTYFSVMTIENRAFTDGGLEHNNPSLAIYYHYTAEERIKSTRPPMTASAKGFASHGNLDFSRTRFTNIGTGAKVEEVESGKRDRLTSLIPGVSILRKGAFMVETLHDIAVRSDRTAERMKDFQDVNPNFIYERFDANHGVSGIKLDNHHALGEIERRTRLYLEEPTTRDLLAEVGSAIAEDYLNEPSLRQNGYPSEGAIHESHLISRVSSPPTNEPPPSGDVPSPSDEWIRWSQTVSPNHENSRGYEKAQTPEQIVESVQLPAEG